MSCAQVVERLSSYRDGDLTAVETGSVTRHLAGCGACGAHWARMSEALEMLSALPRLEAREPIAVGVFDRLDMEARRPSLATLFRPFLAARPVLLPSLLSALFLMVAVVGTAVRLDQSPEPLPPVAAAARPSQWPVGDPSWGSESHPLFPSRDVSTPRPRGDAITPAVLEHAGEGSMFFQTVVRRDGTVSAVTLLDGDRTCAEPLANALRQQRFEPGRFRGQPVAVSVYMLISHTEVRAPIT